MSNEDEDFYRYATYNEISDFASLTLAEVITLEFLARYPGPIIRHTLYTEINDFIKFHEDISILKEFERKYDYQKKFYEGIENKVKNLKNNLENESWNPVSTSTFYNSLTNFEEIGLVKFKKSKSGKIESIAPTPFTKYIPKLLLKFLLNNNIMFSAEYRLKFSETFLEKFVKDRYFNSILTVWFTEYIPFSLLEQLKPFTGEFFILSKNQNTNKMNNNKLSNIHYSKIVNKLIREPNDAFDAVLVPVYKKNPKFYDMNREEILREIRRVTKSEGLIGIVGLADIPITKNPFADELINLYKLSVNNRIFSEEELRLNLENSGFKVIEIFEHQGLIIGIGKK